MVALQKSTNDVDLQLAYFYRSSTVNFTPDRIGDLMYNGVATDVFRGSVVNGIQGDSSFRVNEAHTLRAGLYVSAEKTTVSGASQLLPIDGTTGMQIFPDVPFPAIDTSVLLGWLGGVYVQDEWKLTDKLTLNSGLRFDQMWQYQNANQLSPRLSLTYTPTDGTTFHAGYARYFHAAGAGDRCPQQYCLVHRLSGFHRQSELHDSAGALRSRSLLSDGYRNGRMCTTWA